MSMILSEVALQRTLQIGFKNLRENDNGFKAIFEQYNSPEMSSSYGISYIEKIYDWFHNTKIPVIQAWSFDTTKVPGISIHLADENEDESKAAFGDYWGMGEDHTILTGPVTVSLDIGIHADKSKDHVLWLYYIILYILYKEKETARKLGLQLHTYRANDYNKESRYMADNVWSRWMRFRCTVQHYLNDEELVDPSLVIDVDASSGSDDDNNDSTDISEIDLS